jgi:hypothetical protein
MRAVLFVVVTTACSFHQNETTDAATGQRGGDAQASDAPRDAPAMEPDAAPPAIVFVQGSDDVPSSSSSAQATFAAQTAGDLNLVVVSWIGPATLSTIADTDDNTYVEVGSGFVNADGWTELAYYATDIHGGTSPNKVDVDLADTAGTDNVELRVMEYRGLATTAPVDVISFGTGTGSAVTSGAATTKHAHDLVVGADFLGAGVAAVGPGFTTQVDAFGNTVEGMVVTDVGTYNASLTQNMDDEWVMLMIALAGAP